MIGRRLVLGGGSQGDKVTATLFDQRATFEVDHTDGVIVLGRARTAKDAQALT